MAVWVLVSIAVDGYAINRDYVLKHLPRISAYGEGGTPDQMVRRSAIEPYLSDLRAGYTQKDGKRYRQSGFSFVAGATWVDVVAPPAIGATASSRSTAASLSLLALCLAGLGIGLVRKSGLLDTPDDFTDWVYWQLAMGVVLMCAPTTWVMNVIWILPSLGIAMVVLRQSAREHLWPLYLISLGLLIAALPDNQSVVVFMPYLDAWLDYKYPVGELILSLGLIGLLKCAKSHPVSGSARALS